MDSSVSRQAHTLGPSVPGVLDISPLTLENLRDLPESALIAAIRKAIRDNRTPCARYGYFAANPVAPPEY